eukprot:scaffold319532_cov28-Tisochrysis_lutea.AAC.3
MYCPEWTARRHQRDDNGDEREYGEREQVDHPLDRRDVPQAREALVAGGAGRGRVGEARKEVVRFEADDAHEGEQDLNEEYPRLVRSRELHAAASRGPAEPHLVEDALAISM